MAYSKANLKRNGNRASPYPEDIRGVFQPSTQIVPRSCLSVKTVVCGSRNNVRIQKFWLSQWPISYF
jgi:hypothetical protein